LLNLGEFDPVEDDDVIDLIERSGEDRVVNHFGDDGGDGSDGEGEGRGEEGERDGGVEGGEGDEVGSESLFLDLPVKREKTEREREEGGSDELEMKK